VPGGKVLGVDGREGVLLIGATVGDAVRGVADGANEGDKEGRESGAEVVTEPEATTFQGKVGDEGGKGRRSGRGIGDALEEEGRGRV
jgi:hypothetical protein